MVHSAVETIECEEGDRSSVREKETRVVEASNSACDNGRESSLLLPNGGVSKFVAFVAFVVFVAVFVAFVAFVGLVVPRCARRLLAISRNRILLERTSSVARASSVARSVDNNLARLTLL